MKSNWMGKRPSVGADGLRGVAPLPMSAQWDRSCRGIASYWMGHLSVLVLLDGIESDGEI